MSLESEVQRLRDWRHDVPSQIIAPIQVEIMELKTMIEDYKKHSEGWLTRRDLAVVTGTIGALLTAGGSAVAFAKAMHWL